MGGDPYAQKGPRGSRGRENLQGARANSLSPQRDPRSRITLTNLAGWPRRGGRTRIAHPEAHTAVSADPRASLERSELDLSNGAPGGSRARAGAAGAEPGKARNPGVFPLQRASPFPGLGRVQAGPGLRQISQNRQFPGRSPGRLAGEFKSFPPLAGQTRAIPRPTLRRVCYSENPDS